MRLVLKYSLQAVFALAGIVLWLSLDGDLLQALVWTIKFPVQPGHPIGEVRPLKVGLCLSFSCLVLACSIVFGWMRRRGIALLLMVSLFLSPALILLERHLLLSGIVVRWPFLFELAFVLAKLGLASGSAYAALETRRQEGRLIGMVRAVGLGTAGLMFWISLFDLVYPGIKWR